MSEESAQHWPTERMVMEGHAEFATPEDLEGLTDEALWEVSNICTVEEMAPEECIPCLALVKVIENHSAEAEDDTPKLDNLLHMPSVFTSPEEPEAVPVAEQFASKVAELSLLVEELLNGPPIPPPNVSLPDLALLTMAADKWVKMSEIQGGLLPEQQQVLDATRSLVARLRS